MKREKFSKLQLPPSPRPTYLVDTNIFLEILLSQENAFRAERWIQSKRVHELGISDFSLNTIGLKLYRKQLPFEAFRHKVDLGGLSVFALGLTEWTSVFRNCQKWTLGL
ncbi:MAG: hypothetical protein HGB11_13130 [Chlorobiales bacterium]|nr:hypothetical protein [Chlorobiales bacterium]